MSEIAVDSFNDLQQGRISTRLLTATLMGVCLITLYAAIFGQQMQDVARIACPLMSIMALLIAGWGMPRNFPVGFLASALLLLINWRVAAMLDLRPVMIVSSIAACAYLVSIAGFIRRDWSISSQAPSVTGLHWQMTVVRIYFGFDMVGHFTEKLFAGSASFQHMVGIFSQLGVPAPATFVVLAGLCELGIAIGIGMGLLTRLSAVAATLYFLVANHFGAHFANGFTWSNGPTGGWEYPLLMSVFYLSFMLSGAGRFSLDAWLVQEGRLPASLRWLCAPQFTVNRPCVALNIH
ncbi:DoxX family protein [Pantoea sp. Ap-967]|uniref:DoxX family protein n=1 Tax=Pantoea sp. Ap-967 TaxID=2608362 RepID=UPI00141E186F|nr:DoxX family protein [Pantoea sp. Ap-967]NIE73281.1 DoxX family protein [Pantoea sp. Ap-967]